MKQVAQNFKTGVLKTRLVPSPALRPGGVIVGNAASLISAGTEKTKVETARMSLIAKAKSRPDQVRKVMETLKKEGFANTYRKVMGKLDSLSPLGYSSAGVVRQVGTGVSEFRVGDRVACAGAGYANHAEEVFVPRNLCVRIPDGVSFEHAAFTTVGAIALQGVRQADVRLGESVGVIGLGLVGQLTLMILRASGCRVIGIDVDGWNVDLAKSCGADFAVRRGEDVVAAARELSAGVGLDAVIITAGTRSNDPVELAARLLRDRGRVVVVGAVGMTLPREPYYMKELDLRLSRSYGAGRYDVEYEEKGRDYPIGYVRWTEKRNMEAFLQLVADGRVTLERLLTHRYPVDRASEAYDLLAGDQSERFLGIVIQYDGERPLEKVVLLGDVALPAKKREGIGFIGAGSFARAMLLPYLRAEPLRGIHTASGLTALDVGEKFGFSFAGSSPESVLDDDATGAVFIATRHDSHAALVCAALERGKDAFVEKPLALDESQLAQVVEIASKAEARLLVGFNRRFSPMIGQAKAHFQGRGYPIAINIRINAGSIPKESWIQDAEFGGGRIVGEVCHFVDLAQFMADSRVVQVYAEPLFSRIEGRVEDDSVSITLKMADGSVATIVYLANGDTAFPKERIEVFGGGRLAVVDDFRSLSLVAKGETKTFKAAGQDKGHKGEVEAFLESRKSNGPSPIALGDLVNTTRATFRILEAMRNSRPMRVED